MTLPAQPVAPARSGAWGMWLAIAEWAAGAGVLFVCFLLFHNFLSAYLTFFGDEVVVMPEQITQYRRLVLAGVLVWVTMTVAALVLRRGWLVSAAAAVLLGGCCVIFMVPQGPPLSPRGEVPARPGPGFGCHSGGDSLDCPGG